MCTPSSPTTGLSPARPSRVVSRRPSSRSTRWVVPVGLPSSPRSGASTGDDLGGEAVLGPGLGAELLGAQAERVGVGAGDAPLARRCARRPRTARCTRSARSSVFGTGMPRSSGRAALEPMGTRLMTSTPHAHGDVDDAGRHQGGGDVGGLLGRAALGVDGGGGHLEGQPGGQPGGAGDVEAPACRSGSRSRPRPGRPAAGSTPVRSNSALSGTPSRSAECMVDRPPLRRPTGVRTASTITTSRMVGAYARRW